MSREITKNKVEEKVNVDQDVAQTSQTSPASQQVQLGLEEIVHLAHKIGLEYAAAKNEAERLELMKPTVRARVTIRLEGEKGEGLTEVKLRRLTDTDKEYVEFLEKLAFSRAEADRLRIRYESYKNLFEAKRSLLSYQKAEMKLL